MQKKLLGGVLSLCFATALGGCQFIGAPGLSSASQGRGMRQPVTTSSNETEKGRAHLEAQRNGLAIEAFNRALVFGERPGPPLNGLGVAFARLGRADLAYRFFSQAVSVDPGNQDFARNLDILVRSDGFSLAAMRPGADMKPSVVKRPDQRQVRNLLRRESNRQITLTTLFPGQRDANCQVSSKYAPTGECRSARLPTVAARNRDRALQEDVAPDGPIPFRTGSRKVVDMGSSGRLPAILATATASGSR